MLYCDGCHKLGLNLEINFRSFSSSIPCSSPPSTCQIVETCYSYTEPWSTNASFPGVLGSLCSESPLVAVPLTGSLSILLLYLRYSHLFFLCFPVLRIFCLIPSLKSFKNIDSQSVKPSLIFTTRALPSHFKLLLFSPCAAKVMVSRFSSVTTES